MPDTDTESPAPIGAPSYIIERRQSAPDGAPAEWVRVDGVHPEPGLLGAHALCERFSASSLETYGAQYLYRARWPELEAVVRRLLAKTHSRHAFFKRLHTEAGEVFSHADVNHALAMVGAIDDKEAGTLSLPPPAEPAPIVASWMKLVRSDPSLSEAQALPRPIRSSVDVELLIAARVREEIVYTVHAILLNAAARVIGLTELARGGTLSAGYSVADPFRVAIANAASGLIIVLGHCSGQELPSESEIHSAERMIDAGKVLGIRVVDVVIIHRTGHTSFRDHGFMSPVD